MAKRGRKKGSGRPKNKVSIASSASLKETEADHAEGKGEDQSREEDGIDQQHEDDEERDRRKTSGKRGNRLTPKRGRSSGSDGSRVISVSSTRITSRSRGRSRSSAGSGSGKDDADDDNDDVGDDEAEAGEADEGVADFSSPESDHEQQQGEQQQQPSENTCGGSGTRQLAWRTRKRLSWSKKTANSPPPIPTNTPITRRAASGRRSSAPLSSSTSVTPPVTRKSARGSSRSSAAASSQPSVPEPPRRKAPKVPPPPLPVAPGLGQVILSGASLFLSSSEDAFDKSQGDAARGLSSDGNGRNSGGTAAATTASSVADDAAIVAGGVDALDPDFIEDLLTCWDFLHLMGVAETEAYNAPIPSMVPGQPPLPEHVDTKNGAAFTGGGYFLRPAPSPLGPKGFKAPTLPQLYTALVSPDHRGWLDALQVRLVDMIQDQMVNCLDQREAAVTTRPNSLTWPEFARQAVSAIFLNWTEQDAIFGDTSGAPSQSQAAQEKAARRKQGKTGRFEQQHLSPACAWLDAQHDERRGAGFLESITGNPDKPPPKIKKPPPNRCASTGKSSGRRRGFVVLTEEEAEGGPAANGETALDTHSAVRPPEAGLDNASAAASTATAQSPKANRRQSMGASTSKTGDGNTGSASGGFGGQRIAVAVMNGDGNVAEAGGLGSGGGGPVARSPDGSAPEASSVATKSPAGGGRGKKSVAAKLVGASGEEELTLTSARTPQGSSARVAALAAARAAEAAAAKVAAAAAAKAAEAAAATAKMESKGAEAVPAGAAASANAESKGRGVWAAGARGWEGARKARGNGEAKQQGEKKRKEEEEEEDEDEMLSRTRSAPDAAVLRALRSRLEKWREDNSKSVEKENLARIARYGVSGVGDGVRAGGQLFSVYGLQAPAGVFGGMGSKYGAANIRRFLTHVQAIPMAPHWVSALLTAMRVPTKNAVQVKKVIEDAIEVNKLLSTPKMVLEAMVRSVSPDVYKGFTARYTKDIALEALVDHLIDNPSDVVGLELGPGDEPLLPGTLMPMRHVRATDNPPPTIPASSSGTLDVGGGGADMMDIEGAMTGTAAPDMGSSVGGAKTESMRRCRALVRYLATAPESMAFRRPVDTTVFTDYHKYVDDPCDLRTIDRRLEASDYGQSVVRFANDVRLVWRNGKRYNKEGSEVWVAGDKLSKAFEVLLEKWVMEPWRAKRPKDDKGKRKADEEVIVPEELLAALNFADLGAVPPWATDGPDWEPGNGGLTERHIQELLARVPWSEGCALCGRDDNPNKTLICDRCDREIHMFCLEPKLKKVPDGEFLCPKCKIESASSSASATSGKGKSSPGGRLLGSARANGPASGGKNGDLKNGEVEHQEHQTFEGAFVEGAEGISVKATDGSTVDVTQIAMLIIRLLAQQQLFLAFLEPVDLSLYPEYSTVIKRPMDLHTMYYKVKLGAFGGLHPNNPAIDPPPSVGDTANGPTLAKAFLSPAPAPALDLAPAVTLASPSGDTGPVANGMVPAAHKGDGSGLGSGADAVDAFWSSIIVGGGGQLDSGTAVVESTGGGVGVGCDEGGFGSVGMQGNGLNGRGLAWDLVGIREEEGGGGGYGNGSANEVGSEADGGRRSVFVSDDAGGEGGAVGAAVLLADEVTGRVFVGSPVHEATYGDVGYGGSGGGKAGEVCGGSAGASGHELMAPAVAAAEAGAVWPPVAFETATAPFDHVAFFRDMKLIWKNAQKFNHDGSPLWTAAEHLRHQLDRLYKERLLSVIQGRVPALPRDHMEEFLATQPPWETLCCTCGANADPEAKIKRAPSKKGKGSKKAAAAAAAAAAAGAEADDVVWPALRCFICRRPRHVECLTLPGQARKRHGFWTCPTCKHQPFAPLGVPPLPHPLQQQALASPRKPSPGSGGGGNSGAVGLPRQEGALAQGVNDGAQLSNLSHSHSSAKDGGGGDESVRSRSFSAGSGSAFGGEGSSGDGGGNAGGGGGGGAVGADLSRRGRQRIAKSFGDEFDETPLYRKSSGLRAGATREGGVNTSTGVSTATGQAPTPAAGGGGLHNGFETGADGASLQCNERDRGSRLLAGVDGGGGNGDANDVRIAAVMRDGSVGASGGESRTREGRVAVVSNATLANGPSSSTSYPSSLSPLRPPRETRAATRMSTGSAEQSKGRVVAGWLQPASFSSSGRGYGQGRGQENGGSRSGSMIKAVDWKNSSARKSAASGRVSSVGTRGGGDATNSAVIPAAPKIKIPRPELLGAVVARLTVRRGGADGDDAGEEEEENELSSGSDGGGCSSDDALESGSGCEDESEDGEERKVGEGEGAEVDGKEDGTMEKSKEDRMKRRKKRRRKRKRRKIEEAPVVREAVVTEFDGIEGRYVLVNSHGEDERMTLEELENALRQSQLLYGCSERILPLSPAEIVKVYEGTLDPTSVIRPSPDDPSLAGSGLGGSGAGYGTSAGTVDSKSLELVSLLRNKSYAMFTPAERMRLLRGLCDLAASTGPIKEHLQILQERVQRLESEALASEKQASSMSEKQRFEGDIILPTLKSPRRPQDFSCTHPGRKHYARGLCVSCYQRWLRNRCLAEEEAAAAATAAAAAAMPSSTSRKRPRTPPPGDSAATSVTTPAKSVGPVVESEGGASVDSEKSGPEGHSAAGTVPVRSGGRKASPALLPPGSKDLPSEKAALEGMELGVVESTDVARDEAEVSSNAAEGSKGEEKDDMGKKPMGATGGAQAGDSGADNASSSDSNIVQDETKATVAAAEKGSEGEVGGDAPSEPSEAAASETRPPQSELDEGDRDPVIDDGQAKEEKEGFPVAKEHDGKCERTGDGVPGSKAGAGDGDGGGCAKRALSGAEGQQGGGVGEDAEGDVPARRSKRARKETAVMRESSITISSTTSARDRGPSSKARGVGNADGSRPALAEPLKKENPAEAAQVRAGGSKPEAAAVAVEAQVDPKAEPKVNPKTSVKPDAAPGAKAEEGAEPEAEAKAPPETQPAETAKAGGGGGRAKRHRAPTAFYDPAAPPPPPPSSTSSDASLSHSTHTSPFLTPMRATVAGGSGSAGAGTSAVSATTTTIPSGEATEMSAREKREWRRAQAAERARELRARGRKLAPFSRPLGIDREGKVYLYFRGDPGAVYVGTLPEGAIVKKRPRGRPPLGSSASTVKDDKQGKEGEVKKPAWSIFRGEAVKDLAKLLYTSPIRSESRLAKEMATQLEISLETVPEGDEGEGADAEAADGDGISMGEDFGLGRYRLHGIRSMMKLKQDKHRRSEPPPPWHRPMECALRGAKAEQCQVCMGSCVLFADLRLQAAAAAIGGGGCPPPPPPVENARSSTNPPSLKRAKGSKPDIGTGTGNKKKGKLGGAPPPEDKSTAVTPPEAEGLAKSGKADVLGLRGAILAIAEAVPEKAWRSGQWRRVSYPAWRAFVLVATGPRELMQAMLMMEAGVRKEWLAKWWVKGWSSPAVAMRVVTLQSVSFRAYVLDSAILYEGSTRGGTNVDAPAPPIGKKRGRPKSALSAGPPKGARLFKGFHENTCSTCGEGGTLICCDYCPASYHMQPCLNMTKDPMGAWACPLCRAGTPKQVNPNKVASKHGTPKSTMKQVPLRQGISKPVTPRPVTPKSIAPKSINPKPVTPKSVTPKPVAPNKTDSPKAMSPKAVKSSSGKRGF